MKASRLNLIIALVLALAAGFSVFLYTSSAKTNVLSAERNVQEVLIAKQVIPVGTLLTDAYKQNLLTKDTYPEATLPSGYLTAAAVNAPDALHPLVAQVSIPKGMILSASNFAAVTLDKPNVGPLQVPAGKFAVSVTAPDSDHVGSFIVPGVNVAVFCTYTNLGGAPAGAAASGSSSKNTDSLETRLLVASSTVIGVGSATTPAQAATNTAGNKASSGLITLAASQLETQKIVHCMRDGQVYLSLLGTGTVATPDTGVTTSNLFEN